MHTTDYNLPNSRVDIINFEGQKVYLKRDDLLELGCSKQRSITYMMERYIEQGKKKFTVSSSGNAALVASYVALRNEEVEILKVFLSSHISDRKIKKFIELLDLKITIDDFRKGFIYRNIEFDLSNNPKQKAFQLGRQDFINLRGSTDDLALIGFKTIAYELLEQVGYIDAIFVPASSGTTGLGIYEGFVESYGLCVASEAKVKLPEMHVVQTTEVNALVKRVVTNNKEQRTKNSEQRAVMSQGSLPKGTPEEEGDGQRTGIIDISLHPPFPLQRGNSPEASEATPNSSAKLPTLPSKPVNALTRELVNRHYHPAESIVDLIGHRRLQIEEMIQKTGGAGWIISAGETIEAMKELKEKYGIDASADSALTFAALKKANKFKKYGKAVLVFTG